MSLTEMQANAIQTGCSSYMLEVQTTAYSRDQQVKDVHWPLSVHPTQLKSHEQKVIQVQIWQNYSLPVHATSAEVRPKI